MLLDNLLLEATNIPLGAATRLDEAPRFVEPPFELLERTSLQCSAAGGG